MRTDRRYIRASADRYPKNIVDGMTETLENLLPNDYVLEGDFFNPTVEYVGRSDFMPTITIRIQEENGVYYVEPDLAFPDLNYTDMDYADSMAYHVENWLDVAKDMKRLINEEFDPDYWSEYDEDF